MWWITENRTEAEIIKTKAILELPPAGFSGSLAGTEWDPDAMLADFESASM